MLYEPTDNSRKLIYSALILYWILLLTATSIPSSSMPDIKISDKIEHFGAYAGLTVLLTAALLVQQKSRYLRRSAFTLSIMFASLYGLLDELHQTLIPGRNCSLDDWIADFAGALTGALIIYILFRYERKKIKKGRTERKAMARKLKRRNQKRPKRVKCFC